MATCPECLTHYADDVSECPEDGHALLPGDVLAAESDLEVGTRVGEYVIEEKIGAGSFGAVYRAIQPLIAKQVAVKVLSKKYSADPQVVSRFVAEARAVNQIRHKNIIDIFSFGQLPDGRHYHVMELLQGQPLDLHLAAQGGWLPLEEVIPILRGLARALDAAHAAGIAHRDLKPANVFLATDEEGSMLAKLLDFGIAKLLSDEVPRHHTTATGAAVGTPDYMSPEQCQGPDVDHRTDIYSFGVLTYQLLSGRLPHMGKNAVEVMMKQMTVKPLPPSEVGPHVPPALDGPIMAMLAKAPDERPQTCGLAVRGLVAAAIGAGYALPSASSEHGGGDVVLAPAAPSSGRESQDPPVALAPTLASSSGKHLSAPVGVSKGRASVWLGIGIMVCAVAAVPIVFESAEVPRPVGNEASTQDSGVAVDEVTSKAGSAALVQAPVLLSRTVRIQILGAPEGTVVLGPDDVNLGALPGAIELVRSDKVLQVVLRAKGHGDLKLGLHPVATSTIRVTMKLTPKAPKRRRRPKKPKRPNKDDLEVPSWE